MHQTWENSVSHQTPIAILSFQTEWIARFRSNRLISCVPWAGKVWGRSVVLAKEARTLSGESPRKLNGDTRACLVYTNVKWTLILLLQVLHCNLTWHWDADHTWSWKFAACIEVLKYWTPSEVCQDVSHLFVWLLLLWPLREKWVPWNLAVKTGSVVLAKF